MDVFTVDKTASCANKTNASFKISCVDSYSNENATLSTLADTVYVQQSHAQSL